MAVSADVTADDAASRIVGAAVSAFGPCIDYIINNVRALGQHRDVPVPGMGPFVQFSESEYGMEVFDGVARARRWA